MIGKLHSKHSTMMQSIRLLKVTKRISSSEKNVEPSLNLDPASYKSRIKKDASLSVCADWHDATWCQASLRLPGSPDYNDTVRIMEQTDGRCPVRELSYLERRETQIEMNMDWKANNNSNQPSTMEPGASFTRTISRPITNHLNKLKKQLKRHWIT